MALTEVGAAYVSIYPDTSKFSKNLNNSLSGAISETAIGRVLSDVFSGAMDSIVGALDKGIKRFDTIQNFPKLMETFGYSSKEAADAVKQVSDHLVGLPGSTDEVLSLVQALSDSTSSLGLATSTGIAFNDMLTAGGADAATATLAMRTFDQIMGGGVITGTRWLSLTSKMPKQFTMLAQHILGAGHSSAELGEALNSGEVSLEQLAQAMTDLSPTFEEQARAMSDGIGTAMVNVTNRFAKGWASILAVFGQANIANAISDFANGVEGAMGWVAQAISSFITNNEPLLQSIGDKFSLLGTKIQDAWNSIDWTEFQLLATQALQAIDAALGWILNNGDLIKSILAGIATAIVAVVVISGWTKLTGAIAAFNTVLAANPIAIVIVAISSLLMALGYFFTYTETGQQLWAQFTEFLSSAINTAGEFIGNAFDAIKNAIDAVASFIGEVVDSISSAIGEVADFISGVIESIGGVISGIGDFFSDPLGAITNFVAGGEKQFGSLEKSAGKSTGQMQKDVSSNFDKMNKAVSNSTSNIAKTTNTKMNSVKQSASSGIAGASQTVSKETSAMERSLSSNMSQMSTTTNSKMTSIQTKMSSSMTSASNSVSTNVKNMQGSINSIKGKSIDIKANNQTSAGITAAKNGINSVKGKTVDLKSSNKTSAGITAAKNGIAGVKGKTVDLKASNQTGAGVSAAKKNIASIKGKTVQVGINVYQSGLKQLNFTASYNNNGVSSIRTEPIRMAAAAGGIATKATLGIWGEAGDEALVPLSNRHKVRPFARAVAAEIPSGINAGVSVTGNTFIVRNDNDIDLIANRLNQKITRTRAGNLK